jgi:hypothetical protein
LPAGAQTKEACADAANEAQTLRDAGKYRASRARLLTCASDACPAIVGQSCRQWLSQLDVELPTVIFKVKDDRGRDRADVTVSVDGERLLERLRGTPVPMDPGEHVFRFQATDLAPREQRVVVAAGEKDRLIDVELTSSAPAAADSSLSQPPSPFSTRNFVGLGLGALAVASAVAGLYFVVQSHHEADLAASLRRGIPSRSTCATATSPACTELSDRVAAQHRDTNVSTALFATAIGLAIGAAATWLLWPSAAVRSSWLLR